jgi:hypothetical protein
MPSNDRYLREDKIRAAKCRFLCHSDNEQKIQRVETNENLN